MTSLSLGSSSYHDDNDDNDVDNSLLVSPAKDNNNDCSAFAEEEVKWNAEEGIFKNDIGDDNNIKENSGYSHNDDDKRSMMMDDTFQDDSVDDDDFADGDATTPAKRKFSYAAAMEQLDDSWLAPTPAKPSRELNDGEEDNNDSNDSGGGELSTMEEEGRFETEEVEDGVGSNNLAERWSESPVKDDSLRLDEQQEEMDNVDNYDTQAISSPGIAALVPAPPNKQPSPPEVEVAAEQQQEVNDESILSSPNIDLSTVTTSNNIFRHTSIYENVNDDTDNNHYQQMINLGHPINESYDSVEQQKLHAQQQARNCISGFLVDRDRVTNEIVCLNNDNDDTNDDSIDYDSLIVDNKESYNKSVLETLEEHPEMNDEQEAEIGGEEEGGLTLTQAADCTTDSDGFLKKIEHSSFENNEDLVSNDLDAVASLQQDDNNLALEEDGTLSKVDADDLVADENQEDEKGVVNEYHLSSPSDSEVNVPESVSPVVKDDTSGVENDDEEFIEVKATELTSSRGDSLTFSTSGDAANDTTLGLEEVQNASQSSEVVLGNGLDPNRDTATDTATEQMVGADVGSDNLDYSTSNDQLSNIKVGVDLSFEEQNSLSASLDVSLSNIDREALFSGSFSKQLSPIRQNSSSPRDLSQYQEEEGVDHDLSQHQEEENVDDGEKDDEIQLPAILDTSPISESSSPHDCKPLLGANLCAEEEEERNFDRVKDKVGGVLSVGESLEESPAGNVVEDNKGSIFAVLSEVNTSSNEVVHETLQRHEEDGGTGDLESSYSDISGVDNSKESAREEAQMVKGQASPVETFTGINADVPSPKDYELDERNKSLEDLSSYQHTFSSTSTAFLERLRGAAESRKREVTKARQSMERKEQFLYEEKEEREVMPTLSEVAEETVEEPENRTTAVATKAFKSRPFPASNTAQQVPWRSTSMRGSKRKSPTSSQPHTGENRAYGTNTAINAKPPKRLLSGEGASYAKEMNRKKLLQEDDERIRRDSVFKARPLPATTLPRGHKGGMEQRRNRPNNSKVPRAGKENSAFKPSSSTRAEERAAYNEERKAREDARRHEQIRKRNAIINETSEEIEKLKRLI